VSKALEAVETLKQKGIHARLIDIHTIKPIDEELIINCARETGAVVTAEEHNIYGGLGSAVSEVLVQKYPVPMEMVGVEDVFAESGDYEQLLLKYGLSSGHIIQKVEAAIARK